MKPNIRTTIGLLILNAVAGIIFAKPPIAFEENRGQQSGEVLFLSRGSGYGVFFMRNEAVIATRHSVVRVGLEGAKTAITKLAQCNTRLTWAAAVRTSLKPSLRIRTAMHI
jgi:hypothetical protein